MVGVLLVVMSLGTWAADRVVIATLENGSITAGTVSATGNVTVTLTVTPASGYFTRLEQIHVQKTVDGSSAKLRGGVPSIADPLDVTAVSVDGAGKGTYQFTLPDGYGAYVEATFSRGVAATDGVYYGSLSEALGAIGTAAAEVQMLANADESTLVYQNANDGSITFDLNGKTVKMGEFHTMSSLTIKNGMLTCQYIDNANGGNNNTLLFDNCTVTCTGTGDTYDNSLQWLAQHIVLQNGAKVTLQNGAYIGYGDDSFTFTVADNASQMQLTNCVLGGYNPEHVAEELNHYTPNGTPVVVDGDTKNTVLLKRYPASATVSSVTGLTYDGVAKALASAGTVYGGTGINYSLTSTGTFTATIPTGTGAGTYTVYYKPIPDAYHSDGEVKSVSTTIGKAALTVTAKPQTITYGEAPANDGVTYSGFVNNDNEAALGGTLAYAYNYAQYGNVGNAYTITPSGLTSDNYTITYAAGTLTVVAKEVGLTWSKASFTYNGKKQSPVATAMGLVNGDVVDVTVTGAQKNAGRYTATAAALTGEKAANYVLPAAVTRSFVISKADAQVVAPTPLELTCTDEAQELVEAGSAEGGELQYSLDGENYSTDIPVGTEAGTYTVYYRVVGDENHTDVAPQTVEVVIERAPIPTAIGRVNLDVTDEGWYTLEGVKLNAAPTSRGVYIYQHRKVYVK